MGRTTSPCSSSTGRIFSWKCKEPGLGPAPIHFIDQIKRSTVAAATGLLLTGLPSATRFLLSGLSSATRFLLSGLSSATGFLLSRLSPATRLLLAFVRRILAIIGLRHCSVSFAR